MKPEEDRIVIIQRIHLDLVETKRRAKDRTERRTSQTTSGTLKCGSWGAVGWKESGQQFDKARISGSGSMCGKQANEISSR